MERRGWPWKKRSSARSSTDEPVVTSDQDSVSLASATSIGSQDSHKSLNYVQVSLDKFTHLTGLEDEVKLLIYQVKTLEDQVKELNDKLSVADSELIKKDSLVQQHAKVAEEAVSGWEMADSQTLALKGQLESVTLLKLTADDRASQLDGALKECMRQVRNLQEENEKLNEVVYSKTKHWDRLKLEFEGKIDELDQVLIRSAADNAALSRSLQERSNMLMKLNQEKSQTEAEIEVLKENIQIYEKEISSMKFELNIVSNELDVRNEEKNMAIRSAEAASRKHMDNVKKIAKLEAECQRLRGLVRKKLPGPAAVAQMKQEVENLNQVSGETQQWRTKKKNSHLHPSSLPEPSSEFSSEYLQHYHKDSESLTSRFLAMEEETKMLKEALTIHNSELETSKNICLKMAGRIRILEAQVQDQQKNSQKSNFGVPTEDSSNQNASKAPSLTSVSEDGGDEVASTAESWAGMSCISNLSHRSNKSTGKLDKTDKMNHFKLMDDFLEMERLACLSSEPGRTVTASGNDVTVENDASNGSLKAKAFQSDQCKLNWALDQAIGDEKELGAHVEKPSFLQFQSRILMVLESLSNGADMGRVLEDIKHIIQDGQVSFAPQSIKLYKGTQLDDASCNWQACSAIAVIPEGKNAITQDGELVTNSDHFMNEELVVAISHIHQFASLLGREAGEVSDMFPVIHEICGKCEALSSSLRSSSSSKTCMIDVLLDLAHVLAKVNDDFIIKYKNFNERVTTDDCVDKVTRLVNRVIQDGRPEQELFNGSGDVTNSSSNSEVPQEENISLSCGLTVTASKYLLKEQEQLELENRRMAMDLNTGTRDLASSKLQLEETEQPLSELKSQLAASQKSHILAETQLRCMTESYRALELRAQQLKAELDVLEKELSIEKRKYQDALAHCNELQEQMIRKER